MVQRTDFIRVTQLGQLPCGIYLGVKLSILFILGFEKLCYLVIILGITRREIKL